MKRVFKAKGINGDLIFEDPQAVKEHLLEDVSGRLKVTITEENSKNRSIPQNSYYWGVIIERVCRETGNDPETIHEFFKWKFLTVVQELKGEEYGYMRSTTDLSTKEFNDYNRKCRVWASTDLDLFIPKPNEYEE